MATNETATATPRPGEIIRAALDAQGVSHRIAGEGIVERVHLATAGHDGPTVYISGHDTAGRMGYDTERTGHASYSATVHTAAGTKLLYFGGAEGMTPQQDAEACASAVAEYLYPKSEHTDTAPEPDCGSCEDYGEITTYHPSTDGVTGTRPCLDEACQARRAAAHAPRPEVEHVCTVPLCCPPF